MWGTVDTTASIGLSAAEDALVNAAGQIAAAQCRWLVALGNLDPDGEIKDFYSVASWLSWRCSIHIRTATEYAKVAHALKQLPGITDEFSRARLSYSQVKMLARVATPGTEKVLVDIAQSSTVGQLARVVGTYRSFLQSEADARSRAQARSVATWFDEDGFFVIRGRLCPDEGAVVEAALRRAIDSMPAPARPQATAEDPPGDVFDHYGARQADALAQVARQFLAVEAKDHPAASLPEVVVHFDFETLTGPHPTEAGCHLEGGVALAPPTALRLACDAAAGAFDRRWPGQPAFDRPADPLDPHRPAPGAKRPGQRVPVPRVPPHPPPERPPHPPLGQRRPDLHHQPGAPVPVPSLAGPRGRLPGGARRQRPAVSPPRRVTGPSQPHSPGRSPQTRPAALRP
ncbi:MAG TPA: DUF222 domain-containing protein, partial [Actinomycetota bacterium]|nr:DUF222 domain-containing protein [Actinomycetota bacterium]